MKLLQKTIRSYTIYSLVILAVAIPLFYFAIQRLVKEDIDEHLVATKAALLPKITKALATTPLDQIKFFDQNISVSSSYFPLHPDSFSNIDVYDSISEESMPIRILTTRFIVGGKPFELQIKDSLVDNDELVASIVVVEAILISLLLAGLVLINRKLSGRIWKPFYITLDRLRQYKIEKDSLPDLPSTTIAEFTDLHHSLLELTQRAHQAWLAQKEFTENAAHEMQTPLAVLQMKLELLMQTSPLGDEQAMLIEQLSSASQRMVRLNKSLILLSRIENQQFTDTEAVSMNQVLQKSLSQFQPQMEQKEIKVDTEADSEIILQSNRSLAEALTGNLLSNAIRHNHDRGFVLISLNAHSLVIQNTGAEHSLNGSPIFERFHKESRDANSIGLGLPIVRQICRLYHWEIRYEYQHGLHTFILSF